MIRWLAFLLICSSAQAADLRFRDIAGEVGLGGIVGTTGNSDYPDLSYVNGCGIAVGDVDGDGDSDLYVVQGGGANLLFLREGDRFVESARAWGVADADRNAGALMVDLDGDRLPEMLLSGMHRTRIHWNERGERFSPAQELDDEGMGMSLAVADFTGDGAVDLYLARYVEWPKSVPTRGGACVWKGVPVICGPEAFRPQIDVFHSARMQRHWQRGQQFAADLDGRGMGALVLDANGDGRADLYVANDVTDNFLFVSGDGGMRERALGLGCALSAQGLPEAGMGISAGDVDGDGRQDIVVTNFDGQTHSLYMARARGGFREESRRRGLGAASLRRLSWGAQLADFDNDGDLDLHVVNGHLYANADEVGDGTHWKQPDDLFVNDGRGHFTPLPEGWDGVDAESGRASALLDFDGDGRLDILVWNLGGPLRLLRNESSDCGNALLLTPRRDRGPLAALAGATIELEDGQQRQLRWESGYLGGNELRLHFGLGEGEATVRAVSHPELLLDLSLIPAAD